MALKKHYKKSEAGLFPLLAEGPGFSFCVDGKPFSDECKSIIDFNIEYKYDEIYNVAEFGMKVKNISSRPVRIHDVRSLDIAFDSSETEVRIHTFYGGNMQNYFPPQNFTETEVIFFPAQKSPNELYCYPYSIGSRNGNSSDEEMQIFILEDKGHQGGVFGGVVWSGDWYTNFTKEADGYVHVIGGMRFLDIILRPGEELEPPKAILGFYSGDFDKGCNTFRRFVKDTCLSKFKSHQQMPPVSYDHWFGLGAMINEDILKKQADKFNGLGVEYFVVDAGWYRSEGSGYDFSQGVGNFMRVDERKFPNGMKPLYDYARSLGMEAGLWFEPERANSTSLVAGEVPEAMLDRSYKGEIVNERYKFQLVDLGNRKVLEYIKAYFKKHFEELGLKWIRWDFNLAPRDYWRETDTPGRRGEHELNHIRGLYEMLQWINDEYPDVLIEGCAGGGQRMDFATMGYSPVFWCSDQTFNPHLSRYTLLVGNRILPGIYLNRGLTPCLPEGEDIPDVYFQSHFGGSFAVNDPVQRWSDITCARFKKHVEVYKKLRGYLCEDYYQLLPPPKSLEDNEGWEFIDPEKQKGFIQLFRTESKCGRIEAKVRGLEEDAVYILHDPYTDEKHEYTGKELTNGIEFELEPFSSLVRMFAKK